jgi:hypothetical protein
MHQTAAHHTQVHTCREACVSHSLSWRSCTSPSVIGPAGDSTALGTPWTPLRHMMCDWSKRCSVSLPPICSTSRTAAASEGMPCAHKTTSKDVKHSHTTGMTEQVLEKDRTHLHLLLLLSLLDQLAVCLLSLNATCTFSSMCGTRAETTKGRSVTNMSTNVDDARISSWPNPRNAALGQAGTA